MFYKEKYIAAFSEESDPTHFQQVYDTEEEAKQFLWTSYSGAEWKEFGGWNENGAIPQTPSIQPLSTKSTEIAWLLPHCHTPAECE